MSEHTFTEEEITQLEEHFIVHKDSDNNVVSLEPKVKPNG